MSLYLVCKSDCTKLGCSARRFYTSITFTFEPDCIRWLKPRFLPSSCSEIQEILRPCDARNQCTLSHNVCCTPVKRVMHAYLSGYCERPVTCHFYMEGFATRYIRTQVFQSYKGEKKRQALAKLLLGHSRCSHLTRGAEPHHYNTTWKVNIQFEASSNTNVTPPCRRPVREQCLLLRS